MTDPSKVLSRAAQSVQDALASKGLEARVVELSSSTRTAEDAAKTIGCEVAQIVKSLIFRTKDTGKPILVLAGGVNRVNEKRIAEHVGEKIAKADAEFAREATGFAVGGIRRWATSRRSRRSSTRICWRTPSCGPPRARQTRCSVSRRPRWKGSRVGRSSRSRSVAHARCCPDRGGGVAVGERTARDLWIKVALRAVGSITGPEERDLRAVHELFTLNSNFSTLLDHRDLNGFAD